MKDADNDAALNDVVLHRSSHVSFLVPNILPVMLCFLTPKEVAACYVFIYKQLKNDVRLFSDIFF